MRAAAVLPLLLAALAAGATAAPAKATPQAHLSPATAMVSVSQAQSQAEATGQAVTATALTTDSSTTVANPDGSLTTTESSQPTQAYVNGSWQPLDSTLQASGGSLSPAVTSSPLTLSGGGNSTLAVMTAAARNLTLNWPGMTLPTPSLSGSTATYANVVPGADLVVTADTDGGFTDVLVIHSATAAASPALASLNFTVPTTGDLGLSVDADGNLIAATNSTAPPLASLDAPRIWDSTPAPSGEVTATNQDGVVVDASSDEPISSTADDPGTGANVANVPMTLSGHNLTLTPPTAMLTGSNLTYPLYVKIAWHNHAASHAAAWTQVFSGFPTSSEEFDEKSDLRVGVCPTVDPATGQSANYGCNGVGVAHTIVQMRIPPQLHKDTAIHSAYLYMTEDWSFTCTKSSVRLYAVPGSISRRTDWVNQPSLSGLNYSFQDAAYGNSGCGYFKNDIAWPVTDAINADKGEAAFQAWTMAAADEDTSSNSAVATSELGWKKFKAGAANFTLAVTYNYPPLMPTDLYSNPGGGCHTSSSDPALIGNDDISFYSRARDLDGDNQLTTSFSLHKPDGSLTSLTANVLEGNGESKPWIVARTQITDLNVSGGEYYYQTTVTDDFGLSSSPSPACWILYNPNDPPAPTVTISPTSAAISQQVTVTITTPSCSGTTGSDPCPVSYMVQNGVNAPFSTSAGTDSNHTATPTVLIRQQGSINISVSGVSAGGNIGEQATQTVTGTLPSTPFKDGYFTNGANPDLLTVGTGSHPSLWLYTGSGVGTLNGPTDIGSLGTTINPGTDGPGDWAGAIALHGDFTGDNVQDVMAYYTSGTHAGNGVVIPGDGSATSLNPTGTDADDVMAAYMAGPSGTPSQLVGAGQAGSGQPGVPPTATDNLIGIAGGVELDLYSEIGCRGCGYGYQATLTLTAPDGTASTSTTSAWSHYTIAATHTGATTSLFALNTTTGALYETTGPFAPGENPFSGKTPLSVPWGSSPPQLLGADVNQSGTTELWVRDDVGILEYTVSGTNVQRGCQPISENDLCHAAQKPFDDWPLNDGKLGSTKTTAIDTLTGIQATVKGGASWVVDYYFRMVLSLDGTTGYVLPPSTTIPAGDIGPSISAWFKTTSPGVLASVQADPVTSGSTTTKGYDPVLYVGTDGKLNAKWWNGSIAPIVSTSNVNDNQWHHVELITTVPSGSVNEAPYQTLYIDGHSQGTQSGGPNGNWNNLTFGSGYIGGGWPDEVHYQETGSLEFFNGQIANVTFKG